MLMWLMLQLVCTVLTEVTGQEITVLGIVLLLFNIMVAATYYITQNLDHKIMLTHKVGQLVQQWVPVKAHGVEVILVLLTVLELQELVQLV